MPASNSAADSGLVRDAFSRIKALVNSHASRHAAGGADPVTPASIGAKDLYAESRTGSGEDANLFVTPGTFMLNANALNTPAAVIGYLDVTLRVHTSPYILQEFTESGAPAHKAVANRWIRHSLNGSAWSAWTSVCLDDTRWRQTTAFLSEGFATDKARIRRVGQTVSVNLQGATVAGSNSYVASGMPLGFRPSSSGVVYPIFEYAAAGVTKNLGHFGLNSSGTTFFRAMASGTLFFECSWVTNDPWPTTLPGTPG